MLIMTEPRIRLIIDTEWELRQAVRLRAVKTDKTPSDVVNELIREHLAQEVADVHKTPRVTGKPRRGRKPKGGDE